MTELSPDAARLFRDAREAYAPERARLEKVGAALAVQLASSAGAASAAKGTVHASAWVGSAKILGVVAVTGLAVGLASTVARRPSSASDAPRPVAMASAVPRSVPSPPAVAPPPIETPPGAPARAEAPERGPARARPPASPPKVVLEETPEEAEPALPGETARSATDSMKDAPAPGTDVLAQEIALVQAARAALDGGSPARALQLLRRHAVEYPHGTLVEERLALRALALCALGRVAEARSALHALESASPRSPHLDRIRAACGFTARDVE